MTEWDDFLDRLKAKELELGGQVNPEISSEVWSNRLNFPFNRHDLLDILSYFHKKVVVQSDSDKEFGIQPDISKMEFSTVRRFNKKITHQRYTFVIERAQNGEFKFFVHTNYPNRGNSKREKISEKAVCRLDSENEYTFVQSIDNRLEKLRSLFEKHQMACTPNIEDPTLKGIEGCHSYMSKGLIKTNFYLAKPEKNLAQVLKLQNEISLPQQNIFISNLLNGIKKLHENDWIHQVLKPINLWLYRNGDHHVLKLNTDNIANTMDELQLARLTVGYHSPELMRVYADRKYFPSSCSLFETFSQSFGYEERSLYEKENQELLAQPHKANDIWAAGNIIFEILFAHVPSQSAEDKVRISAHPLLKCMLALDRAKRATIVEALTIHESLMQAQVEIKNDKIKIKYKM